MSSAREIPGYYYGAFLPGNKLISDEEKRKYFKIEAHGSSSNPYSSENIAKRRKDEAVRSRQATEKQLQAQQIESLKPIQRWTNSSHSVKGFMNSREVGLSKPEEDHRCLQAKLMRRQAVWRIRHSDSPLERLTSFTMDEHTGDAVLGTYGGLVSALSTRSDSPSTLHYRELQTTVTRFTSRVTSISLSVTDDVKTLVCCSLGNDYSPGTIHIGTFSRADQRHYGLEVQAVMKPRDKQALFCTTVSRYTPDLFAVGAEHSIFVGGGISDSRPIFIDSHCLSVEFLGEHTFVAGKRNGFIDMYDLRAETSYEKYSMRIRHPSSVTHLRQVEDHLLLAEGLNNSLALYDLRKIHDQAGKSMGRGASTPVVKYNGHVNNVSFWLGFDISADNSVLACAGEDQIVRLWSIYTGQRIHARVSEIPFDDTVVGLQFSRNSDKGLWIAGKDLEFWST